MKDKCLLFYYFTDGAFHVNATHFMITDLKQKLAKYLGKNHWKKYIKNSFKLFRDQ
jgi:hypothetical protein